MAHLKRSILIHAPVEDVYALARDPDRWPVWYVGMSEIEELSGAGEVGTTAKFNYTLAGMGFPVTVEVLEDQSDPQGARWHGRIDGPLAGEQTFTYAPKDGDTEVTAEIEYTVPGKALGRVANRLIVERMQARSLEQTLENLKLLCEEGAD
ncbi:MAG: SRPBCC family protein [Chloroflexota bacterium]